MNKRNNPLGVQVEAPSRYAPEILFAVPRDENRIKYDIDNPEDLFCGFDTWHHYETGFLTDSGLPIIGITKIVYSAASPFIVESKSLKLYFNSFNMTKMGSDRQSSIWNFLRTVKQDLSNVIQYDIEIAFFENGSPIVADDFRDYAILEDDAEIDETIFSDFKENPDLLQIDSTISKELRVCTHLLRSNCKITTQPDWGSVFIHINGERLPDKISLLRYIVSLRNENHFHEEICEMIYKRLWDIFAPDQLAVSCLYTRRGGIEICPSRASSPFLMPIHLVDPAELSEREFRQ